jgi:outer membrane protein, heavy metal efflux system
MRWKSSFGSTSRLALAMTAGLTLGTSWAEAPAEANLQDLVNEAVANNPALQAARSRAAAADRIPARAGSLPDPVVALELSNFRTDDPALSASPMSGVQIALREQVPFPGKLGRRKEVARADAASAWAAVRLQEADLVAQVKSAYWEYAYSLDAESITRDNVAVLNTFVNVTNGRVAVGRAPQQDALKAQVAYAQLRDMLLVREQQSRTSAEHLDILIGRDPGDPIGAPAKLQEVGATPDLETTLKEALETGPRLAVEARSVDVAAKSSEEARFDIRPDFQLSGAYRIRAVVPGDMTEGANMFSLSIGLSLPIFARSKQSQRIEETRHRLESTRRRQQEARLGVGFDVRRLVDEIERIGSQEAIYSKEIVPEANMALNASLSDYQVAKVEFLSVLDNWRRLFDARIAQARIRADRAERLAQLEAVTGRALP